MADAEAKVVEAADEGVADEAPKKPVDPDFEPEIVVFACHYCAYAAADLAGSMRLQYPTNIRMIKIPCTGKLEIIHLLKALEAGADGVYAAGCMEGECHYLKGNLWARKRVEYAKKLVAELGIEAERVEMFNMSSAMGAEFAKVAQEFTERIRELGPSPVRRGEKTLVDAAREALPADALPADALPADANDPAEATVATNTEKGQPT